ncbi:tetratricopeptide repeat protein, partial [Chamaesiphon sp. OTE_8_metabat_110]|uniref:tetratricopeptide repeat protein n=1 Tax=Chamaesiphon sp. OTE_8_metabat_110 TaxID=2964696 RepID=UPI00286A143D
TQIAQKIDPELQGLDEAQQQASTKVNQIAKDITVRITSGTNGGSGVLIAKKANTYLVLTNAHVTRRTTQFEIQAPDGQKYTAKPIDGGFDRKYDLALLEFTSSKQYQLANLANPGILKPNDRNIYSAGYPFDSKDLRISPGAITQLSDIPFDNGTQIGYEIAKGEKGVRQGMSGGPIFGADGILLGINTIGAAPILPNYTYNDGSKPLAKLAAKYRTANWGVPVYNFLIKVKPDILYRYKFNGLAVGQIQPQATPTGYMAKLNDLARKQTVRIENSGGNGSGVIVAQEGNSYYVVTAKHVLENEKNQQKFTNNRLITYDQDTHNLTSTVLATGVDLAIVKFTSTNTYPIAQLGEISPNNNEIVLAGGFPGRDKISSSLWQWQLNPGYVFDREQGKLETQNQQSFGNGYDIIYTSISHGGMSGGGVFDTAGRVIGIHGRAEQTADKFPGELKEKLVMLGSSQGISIQTLIGLAPQLQLNPKLLKIAKTPAPSLTAVDRQTIETAMANLAQPTPEDSGERWLTYGNQLYRTNQFEQSVTAFDRAITKGQILTGNYGRALSLLYSEKLDLASAAIAKAIAAVPAKERANYYYFWKYQSSIFIKRKKYAQALESIDTAIKLEPNDRALLNYKAEIFFQQKQYAAAIKIYDNMIQREESYAYFNRGNAKSAQGDKREAIADYDRAIKINPNKADAYVNRGNAKSALGDKRGAISDYERSIKINPNLAAAYNNRGNVKLELKNNKGAIADYDRAININPNYAEAYLGRGNAKHALGDKRGAIADYEQSIKINPDYAEAYLGRGNIKSERGDNKEALANYELAIKINPDYAEAYCNRAGVKLDLADRPGAIADLSKGAELFRQQGRMDDYQKVVDIIARLKGQGAIADRDRAIKTNPNDAAAYIEQGLAKSERGDNKGAIADFDRAIKINPNLADAYSSRGDAKSALGDRKGAIADFDRAIKINPNDAAAYIGRGGVKLDLTDRQGAIADWSKGAELLRQQGQTDYYQKVMDTIAQLKGR